MADKIVAIYTVGNINNNSLIFLYEEQYKILFQWCRKAVCVFDMEGI